MNEMKKKLDASEEHNISLISDKKKLERDLSREKIKLTQAEEKIGNLEIELADKKKALESRRKTAPLYNYQTALKDSGISLEGNEVATTPAISFAVRKSTCNRPFHCIIATLFSN